jgi:predicted Zn-dependent protease with MMP-like domain
MCNSEQYIEDSDEVFIKYAQEALNQLPKLLRDKMMNVSILVQDEPMAYQMENRNSTDVLLGLYEGIPNPFKAHNYNFCLPDKITLFKNNILFISNSRKQNLQSLIKEVVYHEIGHHFGFNEEDLEPFKTV